MKSWLRRVRAAIGMGLCWALAWAPVGLLIGWVFGGNSVTPDEFPLDDWLMPLAILGFLGGTTFSLVLRVGEGRRRFDDLSFARFSAWGALGGVIVGVLAVAAWQLDAGVGPVLWRRAAVLVGSSALLSASSAAGSLALARRAETRGLLDSREDHDTQHNEAPLPESVRPERYSRLPPSD